MSEENGSKFTKQDVLEIKAEDVDKVPPVVITFPDGKVIKCRQLMFSATNLVEYPGITDPDKLKHGEVSSIYGPYDIFDMGVSAWKIQDMVKEAGEHICQSNPAQAIRGLMALSAWLAERNEAKEKGEGWGHRDNSLSGSVGEILKNVVNNKKGLQ